MNVEWHYSKNGQTFGPVTAARIGELSAAGQIGPDDLVWNSTFTDWVPAHRVAGLTFPAANATQAAATGPALTHPSSEELGPVQMTLRTIDLLSRTRTWVLIVALAMFFEALLLVVRGLGMLVMWTNPSGQGSTEIIAYSLTTVAIGLFVGVPTIYLARYYAHIGNLQRLRRPADLENALNAQRAYWKFLAITTLVLVGLMIVVVVIAVITGAAGWL